MLNILRATGLPVVQTFMPATGFKTTAKYVTLKKILCLVAFLFLSAAENLSAQQPLWHSIGSDQGLPDPNVTAIVRIPGGKLFVGTAIGLYSYDGFAFRKVKLSATGKINPYINCLATDGKLLIVGARDALILYNTEDQHAELLKNPMNCIGGIVDLYLNPEKTRIYARTHCGILTIDISKGTLRVIDVFKNPDPRRLRIVSDGEFHGFVTRKKFVSVKNHRQTDLYTDSGILDAWWWEKENAWLIVKEDGLYLLDSQYRNLTKLPYRIDIRTNENYWIYPDQQGGCWIQCAGKFAYIRSAIDKSPEFHSNEAGNLFSFTSNTAQAFFTDPDGTRWVGGDGTGLAYLSPAGSRIRFLTNEQAGVQHFWCFRYEKETGKLLCGTTSGILEGTLVNGEFLNRRLYHPPGFDRFSVNSIVELNEEEYLISVYREGFWTYNKKTRKFRPLTAVNNATGTRFVFGIGESSPGKAILCTQFSAFMLDKKTMNITPFTQPGFHNYSIYSAIEDSHGRFLIAGGFGLQVFNSELKQTDYYTAGNKAQGALPSNVIFCLSELSPENYLVATMGGGLSRFISSDSTFTPVKLATDPDNVFGIMPAGSDSFILTTSGGLCRVNISSGKSVMLNKSNLLPFNDFNQQAFAHYPEYIFAGGEKGMLILNTTDLDRVFSLSPEIIIRKKETRVQSLKLEPDEHALHLDLSFDKILPGSMCRFRYRIEGIDQPWQMLPAHQNTLIYNYLPPGNYTLEIELYDETGWYNAHRRSVPLTVLPHFYQTWWFRFMLFLALAGVMFLVVRYFSLLRLRWKLHRMDAERKIMLERSRISRELHDNLGSQLTYLISGLETTGLLLKRNNLEKTSGNIDKLQSAARESMQQLRDSIWALNPGSMTLQSLFIQYEKWVSRVTEPYETLQCTFLAENIPDLPVDPLNGLNLFRIMQEAVHNTLKHAQATKLTTTIKTNSGNVGIQISDNGKGFTEGNTEGNGLSSMQQRAEALKVTLTIETGHNAGTTIFIEINKNTLTGV